MTRHTGPQPPYGRDFWPRTHRPDVNADFDVDRPCGNCGYNLRGIPLTSPCPECGSIGGITTSDETIPWDEDRNLVSFIGTVLLVLFRPHTFGKLVWSPIRFEVPAAKQFRRIALIVASISLCAVAEEITRHAVGFAAAMWALPFDAAAIIVWLNSASLEPIVFIRGTGSPVTRRAETVAHYASAALVLTPLQLALLPMTPELIGLTQAGWLLAAGIHLFALFGMMFLGTIGTAWMFYELVDATRTRALGFTLARTMTGIGAAIPLLLGAPALAAAVASKWAGG